MEFFAVVTVVTVVTVKFGSVSTSVPESVLLAYLFQWESRAFEYL